MERWHIRSFTELETFLREWQTVSDDYDIVGLVALFSACVDNLMKYSTEHDWIEAGEEEWLDSEQLTFLEQLCRLAREGHVDE